MRRELKALRREVDALRAGKEKEETP
jgi:hypothetical protein